MGNMGLNVSLRVVWQSLIFGVIASAAWQSHRKKMHLFYEIASFHSQWHIIKCV